MRNVRELSLGAMLGMVFVIAACAGGSPAATPASGATPMPAQSAAASVALPTTVATAAVLPTSAAAPTAATSNADACSLLTVAEVAAAIPDAEIKTSAPSSDSLYSYCKYSGYRDVHTWVTKSTDTATMVYGTMKINAGEAVAGVGDDAWWSTDSYQPGLYFMKNGVLAYISGAQTGPEQNVVDLGKLLASRM